MGLKRPSSGETSVTELTVIDGATIDTTTLVVDDENDRVGIGLTAPKTALTVEGTITLKEQADADADTAAYGQIWVNTATPNELYYTTDAGNDIQITSGTSMAGGITFNNDGNNRVVTGTGAGALNGEANLSFDGSTLGVTGAITASTTITATGRILTDDTTDATSTTDGSLQTDGGLSVALDAVIGNDIKLLSDASVIHWGLNSDITLTHIADEGLILEQVTDALNEPVLTLKNTGNLAAGPNLDFVLDNGTDSTDDDVIGKIRWYGDDGGGTQSNYAKIRVRSTDVTEGAEAADISFFLLVDAASRELFTIGGKDVANATPCEVIVNQIGIDCDFRVEGDSLTHLLFTDAANDRVGINEAAPGTLFQMTGTAPYFTMKNSTAENTNGGCESKLIFEDHANVALAQMEASHSGTGDDTKGKLVLSTHTGSALTAALTIDDTQLSTFAGAVTVTGSTTVANNLYCGQNIAHTTDTDTRIVFANVGVKILFEAGGVEMLRLVNDTQDEIVINDPSSDVDFRVESDDDTHMFFMDANNNRISIGVSTDAPAAVLEVAGDSAAASPTLTITHAEDTNNAVDIVADALTTANVIDISADGLTTGGALVIEAAGADTNARNLIEVKRTHASAVNAAFLKVSGAVGIGMALQIKELSITMATSGTTTTSSNFFPVLGCPIALSIRVTTAISASHHITKIGTTSVVDLFAGAAPDGVLNDGILDEQDDLLTIPAAAFGGPFAAAGAAKVGVNAAQNLVFTTAGTCTGGVVRAVLYYWSISPPTS